AAAPMPDTPVPGELEGYYMLYSSGTTGQPKGILPALTGQPFGTGLNIDSTMKNVFGFSPATVFLCTGPLYHGAPIGWSLGTIRNGGTAARDTHRRAGRGRGQGADDRLAGADPARVLRGQRGQPVLPD